MTKDGKPYGPVRYKELCNEAFLISKNSSTSYMEVMKLTPLERRYITDILMEEANRNKKMLEESKQNIQSKKKH